MTISVSYNDDLIATLPLSFGYPRRADRKPAWKVAIAAAEQEARH